MEFFLIFRNRYAGAKVVATEDATSTILFTQFEEDAKPEVGWSMSTRLLDEPGFFGRLLDLFR